MFKCNTHHFQVCPEIFQIKYSLVQRSVLKWNQNHITLSILTMWRTKSNHSLFRKEMKTTRFMYDIIIPVELDYFSCQPPLKHLLEKKRHFHIFYK